MIERYLSPEDVRRLTSSLLVVLGALGVFLLFCLIVLPGLRNANRPQASPSAAPPQLETGWLDPAEVPPMRGFTLPPVDPRTVMTASPELVERGKALYAQNCGSCHGPEGRGDGPAAGTLQPPPRDFTRAEGWKNGTGLSGIFRTLKEGIPGSGMNAFDTLRAKDRMALAHYVQSLGSFAHGPDTAEALAELSARFATAGETVPNRIPVSRAMAILAREHVPPRPLDRTGGEASLLARAVAEPARAAATLAVSPEWRTGIEPLARLVAAGAPGNGFSVAVATFGPEEWAALHRALLARAGVDSSAGGGGGR